MSDASAASLASLNDLPGDLVLQCVIMQAGGQGKFRCRWRSCKRSQGLGTRMSRAVIVPAFHCLNFYHVLVCLRCETYRATRYVRLIVKQSSILRLDQHCLATPKEHKVIKAEYIAALAEFEFTIS